MQREVLSPLGMRHSTYQWSPELRASMAAGYQVSGRPVEHRSYPEAAGGLYSTAADLAAWLAAGMPGPDGEPAGRDLLQPGTVAAMIAPVLATEPGGNGLGTVVETLPNGTRMILHSGDFPGWRGQYAALPDAKNGIVVLTNGNAGGRYAVADTICSWSGWAAGVRPKACQIYQALYVTIPILAGIAGLGVLVSIWRWMGQLRSNRRRLAWPPRTDGQRRDIILALLAIALWWLVVTPRIGLLLPPSFNWINLAYTLWCLVVVTKGLTSFTGEPT